MEQTLLLNATYEPLRVVHWQKAITLWCQGKVEIVAHYDREIRSVSFSMQPAVRDPPAAPHPRAPQRGIRAVFAREHLRARQPFLPVLRRRAGLVRAHVRPRRAGGPWRPQGLGKHRHLLHQLQPEEGRTHARAGGHAPHPPSEAAGQARRRSASRSASATRPTAGATTSTGTSSSTTTRKIGVCRT